MLPVLAMAEPVSTDFVFEREMLMQEMPPTLMLAVPTHCHYYSNYIYVQARCYDLLISHS